MSRVRTQRIRPPPTHKLTCRLRGEQARAEQQASAAEARAAEAEAQCAEAFARLAEARSTADVMQADISGAVSGVGKAEALITCSAWLQRMKQAEFNMRRLAIVKAGNIAAEQVPISNVVVASNGLFEGM